MSRPIKFRAWDREKMIYDVSLYPNGEAFWNTKGKLITESTDQVMQFTGLLDKNGKEIYEGDIISRSNTLFGEVFWDNENSMYRFRDKTGAWTLSSYKKYEAIGNIYENPELLAPIH
jgi:YopX protein